MKILGTFNQWHWDNICREDDDAKHAYVYSDANRYDYLASMSSWRE